MHSNSPIKLIWWDQPEASVSLYVGMAPSDIMYEDLFSFAFALHM